MSGWVVVYLCNGNIVVVMFWSVSDSFDMYEGMGFCAGSEDVKIGDVEDLEFYHDGFCVCFWG